MGMSKSFSSVKTQELQPSETETRYHCRLLAACFRHNLGRTTHSQRQPTKES